MKNIAINKNRLCYILKGKNAEIQTTISCGHMTADFNLNGKTISPFYVAPWYNEQQYNCNNCDRVLRGNFFCFPFGLNLPYNGIDYPGHGFTVSDNYNFVSESHDGDTHSMTLSIDIEEDHCTVERTYTIKDNENNIYQRNTITGATGKYPVGYHPTIDIPTDIGSAIVDCTTPLESRTSTVQIEDYTKGGYSSLVPDYKIEDMTKVPTVYGKDVDLTRQPFIKGFDDIYMHMCDPEKEFTWTTVTIPSRGYMYYQFKNPRSLANTMYWTSYCGRHYEPWFGRVNGCFEIGELNGYFYYGITECDKNPLSERGYTTCTEFDGTPMSFDLIEGVCEIPEGFEGVKDIVRSGEGKLKIIGKKGEEFEIACDIDFIL